MACGENEELCEETSTSVSYDNHSDHKSNEHNSHTDCHCHQGHSHSFPLSVPVSDIETSFRKVKLFYPEFLLKKPQPFYLDIIRPPIFS